MTDPDKSRSSIPVIQACHSRPRLHRLAGALGNIAVIGVVAWLHVIGVATNPEPGLPLILGPAGADRWTSEDSRRKVWRALRRALAQGDLTAEEQMCVLDALVTDGLLVAGGPVTADPAPRPELDAWSQRALRQTAGAIKRRLNGRPRPVRSEQASS